MNLRTKIPAVIWLPLITSIGIVLLVTINRVTMTHHPIELMTTMAPTRHKTSVTAPVVRPVSKPTEAVEEKSLAHYCSFSMDSAMLPEGWKLATFPDMCLVVGYPRDWVFNFGTTEAAHPSGQFKTSRYSGVTIRLVERNEAEKKMSSNQHTFIKRDGYGDWRVWTTEYEHMPEGQFPSTSRIAYVFSPEGDTYHVNCGGFLEEYIDACHDFDVFIKTMTALRSDDQPSWDEGESDSMY